MTDKHIVPVDDLTGAVADWRTLDKDALLDIGDRLNDVHKRLQLVIGAWLYVYEDALAHGDIKLLAERWERKENTLSQWKRVYLRTRNVEHAKDLPFGKMQELARIPEQHQGDWTDSATTMKRAELRAAVSAAKVKTTGHRPLVISSYWNRNRRHLSRFQNRLSRNPTKSQSNRRQRPPNTTN